MSAQTVSSNDRMMFAIFVALMVHAMLVLGISFSAEESPAFSSTLDVTLAGYRSEEAPEDADFLAQENQQGSGTLDEAEMQTTDVEADFHANDIRENVREEQMPTAPRTQDSQHTQVLTATRSPDKTQEQPNENISPESILPDGPQKTLLERSREIQSLMASIDWDRQQYAKMPNIKTLTATSTKKASDAYYLNQWRRQVERTGSSSFPTEANTCSLGSCDMRLAVVLRPNGHIHEIEILESSGRQTLDQATIELVKRSAPFAPFTPEMLADKIDLLRIIRTWTFKDNNYFPGSN